MKDMAKEFQATVDAWVLKTRNRLENVVKQSAQDVIETMQLPVQKGGNMPVKTGFLRSSLRITIGGPATGLLDRPADYNYPDAEDRTYELTILGAKLGDSIYAVYLANYAASQEYGSGTREGKGFRRLAAQQWPQIVDKNAKLARSMFP